MGEQNIRGGLLYAQAESRIRARFQLEGFDVWVATVDLQAPWDQVLGELQGVLAACLDPDAIGGPLGLVEVHARSGVSRFPATN